MLYDRGVSFHFDGSKFCLALLVFFRPELELDSLALQVPPSASVSSRASLPELETLSVLGESDVSPRLCGAALRF